MARRRRVLGGCGWLAVLAAGCELVTDFSPVPPPDAGDVDAGRDAEVADGTMRCGDVVEPCPPGMMHVPCGPFLMGSEAGAVDERPAHIVKLSAYCIDAVEVTNVRYAECVRSGVCPPPHSPSSAGRAGYYSDPAYAEFPVVHVDWGLAAGYCAWVGKRLPTEAEWEKAARGGCEFAAPVACGDEDLRTYPWGEAAPGCDTANAAGCTDDTDRAGARAAGASPHGVLDAAGNAAEWVADWYAAGAHAACPAGCTDPPGPPAGSERVLRGGSWASDADGVRVSRRASQPDAFAGDRVGFRCAATIR